MKTQMIRSTGVRSGWRYFCSVIKITPDREKFALPFLEIRD
jgi:hypothetical protein